MTGSKVEIIKYRISRARDTYEDAQILAEKDKWNSCMNRLYYSAYYAVMALLLNEDLNPTTHTGTKSNFTRYFIKTGRIPKEFGEIYSQLFTWRQKSDYSDLFDFDRGKVFPYFDPVKNLIEAIEREVEK